MARSNARHHDGFLRAILEAEDGEELSAVYGNDASSGGQRNLASVHNDLALLTTDSRFQNPNLADE